MCRLSKLSAPTNPRRSNGLHSNRCRLSRWLRFGCLATSQVGSSPAGHYRLRRNGLARTGCTWLAGMAVEGVREVLVVLLEAMAVTVARGVALAGKAEMEVREEERVVAAEDRAGVVVGVVVTAVVMVGEETGAGKAAEERAVAKEAMAMVVAVKAAVAMAAATRGRAEEVRGRAVMVEEVVMAMVAVMAVVARVAVATAARARSNAQPPYAQRRHTKLRGCVSCTRCS